MSQPPDWLIQIVHQSLPSVVESPTAITAAHRAAQLLWQRGLRDPEQVVRFLHPDRYQPTSPFELGEMQRAVDRLLQARQHQEIVGIWGDFDADGITATAVLWEGLGQFFEQHRHLTYYIPNRLTESHGLSVQGIQRLYQSGCQLIVTCDMGSTNAVEIDYARSLGMDVIITDHHTLPQERPPVAAILNPRYLPIEHPLANLSGVAVAYKLIEALYQVAALPDLQPLEHLLDLVAIGLIADLVNLTGDCRYLAQRGIERLKQVGAGQGNRPGIVHLLKLCKRSGDRPTDISFGLGPRINAVSRIQGDAHFCVELLTSRDAEHCQKLALATELANTRRKALQKEVVQQVKQKLAQMDLSTTSIIVLADSRWSVGILGLVAGQIAQEYDRPTLLLHTESPDEADIAPTEAPLLTKGLARGSARSVHQIDLYQLMQDQQHLLHSFGGHPLAAGLSLPVQNIAYLTEALNQKLRQQGFSPEIAGTAQLKADLTVTVSELGKMLFQALKLLEPCGMGNPAPRLLIQNCWFDAVFNQNLKDLRGRSVQYIKTSFKIYDDSTPAGFPGVWWGHYREEIPPGRCDAIVELDFSNAPTRNEEDGSYEVRILTVQPCPEPVAPDNHPELTTSWIVDWRNLDPERQQVVQPPPLSMTVCPSGWTELSDWFRRAVQHNQPLAIAYSPPLLTPTQVWQQLLGIAKYLSRTGESAAIDQITEKLNLSLPVLQVGLQLLQVLGFELEFLDPGAQTLKVHWHPESDLKSSPGLDPNQFLTLVAEAQFQQRYFCKAPLEMIAAITRATVQP